MIRSTMRSIVEQVLSYEKTTPNKIAVTDGKKSLTFGELAACISFAMVVLEEEYRLKKGDAVIIAADKQIEFVALYLACHALGIVTLPIAPDTNQKRYRLIKERVKPKLVVGFKDTDNSNNVNNVNNVKTKIVSLSEFSGFADTDGLNVNSIELDDLADIMFTTGTTGEPKGVQLTHRNIAAAARNINTFIRNEPDDVEMIALPISHSFGIGRMRCALSNGQTVVMLGSFANAKRFFHFMEEYKVTGFGMVPASWALLKRLSGMKIQDYADQLHYIEIGSAPMPIEEKHTLIEALPKTRICMHYGLTEASRSAFMEFHECKERLTTIGKQSPNMNITIRDETGKEVPDGSEGEICVSGDAVTKGYLNLPREESFWEEGKEGNSSNSSNHSDKGNNSCFRTGDWGVRDSEGFITLKSRKKELINVGGKKVSPLEIEEVLQTFPFVKDCACVSIPDPEGVLGEVVKAFIVTDTPEKVNHADIDKLIGDKLEGYKHPVIYEVIDEIPKTSSGKVQRLSLKASSQNSTSSSISSPINSSTSLTSSR